MTNAEVIEQALKTLGAGWHTTREIMWQARRGGWQMSTGKTRNVCRALYRANKVDMLVYGGRYSFEIKN